uniref:Small ribosomal subunit protein uS11c n=1 Tax=Sciaphila thaidanica TaxID=2161793 RepID=A0A2R4PAJ5_9LILI|nr:ribosomal protein S11 [Sciaphila thaidanica]
MKREKIKDYKMIIHIQSSLNNTIVTGTDIHGKVFFWSSGQTYGLRRTTPYAALIATINVILRIKKKRTKFVKVIIRGIGSGRDISLRTISRSGVPFRFVFDTTFMPHNGCRPPKRRRL